jgi:hypothetical protein
MSPYVWSELWLVRRRSHNFRKRDVSHNFREGEVSHNPES